MMKLSPLEETIIFYNEEYREGNPSISDMEYDYLLEKLRIEKPDSFLLKKSVIEDVKENRKKKLPVPMYSLEKDKSLEDFRKHLSSNNISSDVLCVITPKLDGISLLVEEKKLQQAWTRGDGEYGQESTNHFKKMNNKITDMYLSENTYSYGEAIISKDNWAKYFDGKISPYNGKPYKSARNTVGGLLNCDDPREELKYVDYIRYGLSKFGSSIYDHKEGDILVCNSYNKVICNYKIIKANKITEELLNELYQEWSKEYQIDGLVIDIDDENLRKELGRERNNNPKYARAIKLPKWGGNAIVKVLGLTLQVSKQGNIIPVINIEPVNIGGATISNVTGYNAKYVLENHIDEGSVIEITRSGDVIPKHLKTITYDPNMFIDDKIICPSCGITCPSCGGDVIWDETSTHLCCTNPDCDEQQIGKLIHFFKTLEVEEFGEPTIKKFYYAGYKTPLDVLKMDYNDIISIEGFATKSANNLLKEFQKLKDVGVTFAKLVHAGDFMEGGLGSKTIQLILDELNGDDPYNQKKERLIQINGIADKTANIFNNGMQEFLKPEFQELFNYITILKENDIEITGNKFAGFKMCFTGVRPSKEQETEIKSQGGEIVDGVSKNTTHLVVKDLSDKTLSSGKSVKAQELNIKILTIEELFD